MLYLQCPIPTTKKVWILWSGWGVKNVFKNFPVFHLVRSSTIQALIEMLGLKEVWSKIYIQAINEVQSARTPTQVEQVTKKDGFRYSELVRLPYFDIIRQHVCMYLGLAKHAVSIWKGFYKILSLIIYKPKLIVCLFQLEIVRMPYKIKGTRYRPVA